MKIICLCCLILLNCSFASGSFYPKDYEESRNHFRGIAEAIQKDFDGVVIEALPIASKIYNNLTIDTLYIPQTGTNPRKLLIISGGVHGIEAFTSSAIQFEFLKQKIKPEYQKEAGLLIIHAVNPYGYKALRRVTENNVDLNRNLSATPKNFENKIIGYAAFNNFLNPRYPVRSSGWETTKLFFQTLYRLMRYGRKKFTEISLSGQYENPKGIYFGGHSHEPHRAHLKKLFEEKSKDYEIILHIDLHTGYGEKGTLHLFSDYRATSLPGFDDFFAGYKVDFAQDKDFYKTTGSFDGLTIETIQGKTVVPMTFEFGTMDSQTTLGGFLSLQNMVLENQGFHWKYADQYSEDQVKESFLEMFNPPEKTWRDNSIKQGVTLLGELIERMSKLESKKN